jgi:uncharacterized protein YndB with AHSA1/START domain
MSAQSQQTQTRAKTAATKELEFTRTLDAPVDRVFKAWTDPKQLAQWWGPEGFTNPTCEIEPRLDGRLYIVMRGPDGADYPMSGRITEIRPPSRLAFTNIAEDKNGTPHLEGFTAVSLTEQDGKTLLHVQTGAVTLTEQGAGMLDGMEQGWSQTLGRLEKFLSKK